MFSISEIAAATGGKLHGSLDGAVEGVSTDSRTVKAGELFIPLKGERFDGHDYITAAWERGVRVFLAEPAWLASAPKLAGAAFIETPDTLKGLGDLAAFHRRRFTIPIVGVTGSNGKTTTKEMLASILAITGPGLKTSGNLNNLIGLPQMLFRLTAGERWGVLEMGMSEFGEIDRLAEIAAPGLGIITNAFPAHLQTMGSVEGVAKAKGELFLRLPAGGWAIFNGDDPLISALPSPEGVHRLSFGLQGADVTASDIKRVGKRGQSFTLRLPGANIEVMLHALGLHNVHNALAASAAAYVLGVDPAVIAEGVGCFRPYDKRFRVEEVADFLLIDDSYNANPASVGAALVTLKEIKEESRGIAVLGDMLELGAGEAEAHRQIGRLAADCVDRLYLMGKLANEVAAGALHGGLSADSIILAESHKEIMDRLASALQEGDCILVKGSRGMGMEKVAEGLRNLYGQGKRAEGAA